MVFVAEIPVEAEDVVAQMIITSPKAMSSAITAKNMVIRKHSAGASKEKKSKS